MSIINTIKKEIEESRRVERFQNDHPVLKSFWPWMMRVYYIITVIAVIGVISYSFDLIHDTQFIVILMLYVGWFGGYVVYCHFYKFYRDEAIEDGTWDNYLDS